MTANLPATFGSLRGYLGYANQWDHFGILWNAALKKHDVRIFICVKWQIRTVHSKKWLPPEEHQDEVIAFFRDLTNAILKCNLYKVSSAVWLKDLERFNAEKDWH